VLKSGGREKRKYKEKKITEISGSALQCSAVQRRLARKMSGEL
jgi:hypothetical protein